MPTTYEPIATFTAATATGSVSFSNIPNTYTDLLLVLNGSLRDSGDNLQLRFNGDTSNLYSQTEVSSNGSTSASQRTTGVRLYVPFIYQFVQTVPFLATLNIPNYAGSTLKTALVSTSNDANGSGAVARGVLLYRSTSAITSLELTAYSGIYNAGTTATLYGIKNA
jgi:hypothetical protein